ncbi:hypothetical protein BJV85_002825 [Clostridium acetobutylicum]|uniref:Predicted integrase of XerC/XerD family, diverged n=1 Tax=Clostridium acetobutylicum (strain ATCC 824 / DSM 792 / JCM 1419 / IAM 19013 / LMG 5710 / NBRC 13948 / NRRL B-527 / VKM B-1787 / 2291 / W) TaxID=272562 RepID=Q97JV1_CLOAB|nr:MULTISPECIES: integrase [Clostridium]AAK79144.1 Predicted integrase of XerC/XerD family, diverged [Clostridium acetobutylicum ATCC 824]ADZ20222.1 integrase of XerC/XerD family, diverged [Clostridium acetobutylicum EA 2018]AEI31679.1 integrase of XerC/XerD family, diverged [Clostridium acetobutylicum DSM 1731]AWV81603.1 integrase [Clostridium acetobutylicum]MBC2393245.1 phage integrase family protein [Clostridium acetobutylicum]
MKNTSKYYYNLFTQFYPKASKRILKTIIEVEEKTGKGLMEWEQKNGKEVGMLMDIVRPSTPRGVNSVLLVLRQFAAYVAYEENITIGNFPVTDLSRYVKKDEVKETLISYKQYKDMCGVVQCIRDRLVIELSWEGLKPDEIQNLKMQDISFLNKKALLKTKNKEYIIEDKDIIKDLHNIENEKGKEKMGKDGRVYTIDYKECPYVIKALLIGCRTDGKVKGIRNIFSKTKQEYKDEFRKININLEKVDLRIVRMSKMLFLLKKGVSIEVVAAAYGYATADSIKWLTKLK